MKTAKKRKKAPKSAHRTGSQNGKKVRTVAENFGHGRRLWKSDKDFQKFLDILEENSKH
ncbi:MAG TPA: hypothetical protein VM008_21840 [Phycisphaerae bacterium]|nr:hypothetical protein [Phycisphaerae bacterium]